jgi:hypothetical protein
MPLEMLPDDTERWQKEEGLTNAGSHCLRKKNLDCVRTFYASAVRTTRLIILVLLRQRNHED